MKPTNVKKVVTDTNPVLSVVSSSDALFTIKSYVCTTIAVYIENSTSHDIDIDIAEIDVYVKDLRSGEWSFFDNISISSSSACIRFLTNVPYIEKLCFCQPGELETEVNLAIQLIERKKA